MINDTPIERPSLAAALNFTPADLDANRDGRISETQAARIRRSWRLTRAIVAGLLIVLVLLATTLIYFGQQSDSAILTLTGITLAVINAGVAVIGVQNYLRLSRDFNEGRAIALTGSAKRTVRVNGRNVAYLIEIDGQRLPVSKDAFNAFEENHEYHVYLSASSRRLLSAEAV